VRLPEGSPPPKGAFAPFTTEPVARPRGGYCRLVCLLEGDQPLLESRPVVAHRPGLFPRIRCTFGIPYPQIRPTDNPDLSRYVVASTPLSRTEQTLQKLTPTVTARGQSPLKGAHAPLTTGRLPGPVGDTSAGSVCPARGGTCHH
jgi:hypothetical protein